jgi:hypothetical protein
MVTTLAHLAASASGLLFIAAALGKLDSWREWSQLTLELAGPSPLREVVRFMVPAIEAVVAILSFVWPPLGLAAAAAVLSVLAVGVRLVEPRLGGRECNCFGAIAPARISGRLVLRNAGLAAIAIAAFFAAWHADVRALSPLRVLATVLFGATGLMAVEYKRLRQSSRAARTN